MMPKTPTNSAGATPSKWFLAHVAIIQPVMKSTMLNTAKSLSSDRPIPIPAIRNPTLETTKKPQLT
ncbi:hypothetical protein [Thermococcus sp.]|uniref:hypothetical protein n=1 Tax=Thermococcus sp. TaxID=35749 RepID=UPI0025DE3424|nr:hypothetical protein [Thermococcus sp.]